MPDRPRPNPGLMPKKRVVVPAAPASGARPRPAYATEPAIPRRGDPDAVAWPDTGVLLSVHATPEPPDSQEDFDLPDRFREHYRKRLRLAPRVASEIRSQSYGVGTSDRDIRLASAASLAYQRLLLGDKALTPVALTDEDVAAVETVKAQLRALPGANQDPKKHQGEAECIVLAEKAAAASGGHLLLANDAGASVIAKQHGLPSRHTGDVLGELSCADPDLDAATCLRRFKAGNDVSTVPPAVAPQDEAAFECASAADGTCPICP